MDSKSKKNKSAKQSDKILTVQTEKKYKKLSSLEPHLNEKQVLTLNNLNNRQKLIFFISDKHKFYFKSYFDQKGTKAFLNSKEEAMKKIELDEYIKDDNHKSDKLVKNHRKLKKMRSDILDLKKLNKNSTIKDESIKKKKKRNKNKSTKLFSNLGENKIIELKKEFDNLDELLKWEPHSPNNRKKRRKLINDDKNYNKVKQSKHLKKNINIDKSLNSIVTVDSKLFNSKMEYDKYKHFITKGDKTIFEDILYELDVNKE